MAIIEEKNIINHLNIMVKEINAIKNYLKIKKNNEDRNVEKWWPSSQRLTDNENENENENENANNRATRNARSANMRNTRNENAVGNPFPAEIGNSWFNQTEAENNSSTKGKIKMMKEANSKGNIPRKKEIAKTIGEKLNENSVKGSEVMWYSNKDNRFKKGVLGNPNEYRAGVGKKYKINNAKEINGTTIFSPQSPVSVNTLRKYNNNIRNIM